MMRKNQNLKCQRFCLKFSFSYHYNPHSRMPQCLIRKLGDIICIFSIFPLENKYDTLVFKLNLCSN